MSEQKLTVRKEKTLEITKTYDITKPVEAVQMAVLLKDVVVNQKLYVNIKGRNYAMVEGWMLAGMLTSIDVMVEEPKNLSTGSEVKYSCTAKLLRGGTVVGVGYAVCSSKEAAKKGFDEYAILSMAQTRAIGKAYRNKIGFIMKLAGFQATPSEEMHKVGETPVEPVVTVADSVKGPNNETVWLCTKCDAPVDQTVANYSQKLYGKILCREDQKGAKKK